MTYRFVSDGALRIAQIALLLEAVVRGVNYLVTPPASADTLTLLEASAPLWVWGWGFILLGGLGVFGEALMSGTSASPGQLYNSRAWPSFIAHSALMFLFISLALSAGAGVMQREHLYGFVAPYDLLAFSAGHLMFARRRKHVR